MCAGFAIVYAVCATAGGTEPSRKKRSLSESSPGLRTPNTRTPGACASRSFAPGGSTRRGSLTLPRARFARRLLEQQTEEPPLREPQQEIHNQPEQQQRVPRGPHALLPELAMPRRRRARAERPGRVMMTPGGRPSCLVLRGKGSVLPHRVLASLRRLS